MASTTDQHPQLPLNQVIHGDCVDVLAGLPEKSVDLIFADPPYNLQLQQNLYRPNMTLVDAVDDDWDRFDSFQSYDSFTHAWLNACRRVLKDNGTLWVIGSYHNIYRIGSILQDIGFWMLNDILWIKVNPMPNFRGVRFANAHETLLWAAKQKGSRYTFNHFAMKALNEDKQMRSDWLLPICSGQERLKQDGKKAHPTQKPEALLYRVLLSSSNPGDVVLDPFFGTGTTGAVAKKLHRRYIGIERDENYVNLARERLSAITPELFQENTFDVSDRRRQAPRVAFSTLLEYGLVSPGQPLFFKPNPSLIAHIRPDANLSMDGMVGSIHTLGKQLLNGAPCNGWDNWLYMYKNGASVDTNVLRGMESNNEMRIIDDLRQQYLHMTGRVE